MIVNQTPYPINFEMKAAQALTCRYGEVGRQYKFIADIDLTGLSANVQVIKPDGTFVIEEATVTVTEDEQYIVVEIPLQATVVKGVCRYDINLFQNEDLILYTAEGPLWVDDQLITEDMIESVAEVYGLRFPQDFLTVDMIPEIAAQVLPEVLPAERGFYLRASQDTGEPEWAPIDMPYPGYSASDAGKALTVNADGTGVEWKNIQHVYSTQEKLIGKWINNENLYERIIVFPNVTINGGGSDYKYKGDLMIRSIIPDADIILPDTQHSYYVSNSDQFSFIGLRINCTTGELVVVTLFAVNNADLHICLQYTKHHKEVSTCI